MRHLSISNFKMSKVTENAHLHRRAYLKGRYKISAGLLDFTSVRFATNSSLFAATNRDGTLYFFHNKTGSNVLRLNHGHGLTDCWFSPSEDGSLAATDEVGQVCLFDVRNGLLKSAWRNSQSEELVSIAYQPQGTLMACGSVNGFIFLFDFRNANEVRKFWVMKGGVTNVHFNWNGLNDDSYFKCLNKSNSSFSTIKIYDVKEAKCVKVLSERGKMIAETSSARFSRNGRYVLTASLDSTVRIWEMCHTNVVQSFKGHQNDKYPTQSIFMKGTRDYVVCGADDGTVHSWNVQSGESSHLSHGCHDASVSCLDFDERNQLVVSGCRGNKPTIQVWNVIEND
ncbi:hypothetical protein ACOME3_006983 [Neoechinorhynchus agilis]